MTHDDRASSTIEPEETRSSRISGEDKPRLNVVQETALLVVIALVVAIVVKQFVMQAFYIPSESMEPGLIDHDRILVEKPSYSFGGEPKRGDVIVFKDPGGWLSEEDSQETTNAFTGLLAKIGLYPTGGHLVKRVVGVGGDTISCCDVKGRIKVNGTPINEPYARPGVRPNGPHKGQPCYGPMVADCRWKIGPVPQGYVFVMGDNRARSADSTVHMCIGETECGDSPYVPVDDVVGKVFSLAWPLSRAHWERNPGSFDKVPDR